MLRTVFYSCVVVGCFNLVGCTDASAAPKSAPPAFLATTEKPAKPSIYDYPDNFQEIITKPVVTEPPESIKNYFE